MPKPDRRPKPKRRSYSTNTGITRSTDTEQQSENRRTLEKRAATHTRDTQRSGKKADRQYRQTDTGTSSRNAKTKKERRTKNMSSDYMRTHAQKIDRMTDTHTGRSAKVTYGNREATKRTMQEKYGNSRTKASAYDRADYKGREIERKVKQRWKPSDVTSQRPGESGREWGNHKYIDKVRTKSGKIRYVYEIEGGGSKQTNPGDLKKKANAQRNLLASARKASSRNTGRPKSSGGGSFRSKAGAWLKNLFG